MHFEKERLREGEKKNHLATGRKASVKIFQDFYVEVAASISPEDGSCGMGKKEIGGMFLKLPRKNRFSGFAGYSLLC